MNEFEVDRQELRTTSRALLAKESSPARVRAFIDDPAASDAHLWDVMTELGWLGIEVPAAHGGAGAAFDDLAVILTELGRALAPSSFLATTVLGVGALVLGGTDDQRARWLPRLATGDVRATAALTGPSGRVGERELGLTAMPEGDGWRIDGVAAFIPDAHLADVLVLAARAEGGTTVFLVERGQHGLEAVHTPTIDLTRRIGEVRANGVRVDGGAVMATTESGTALVGALVDRAAASIACDSLGVAEHALELTVDYAKQRIQFDRPIGSFQAVKHRCTDMFVRVESSRMIVEDAVDRLAKAPFDATAAASSAKSYGCEAAAQVAGDGVQLHGGIGYTWEHDSHLLLKRAKLNEALFGSTRFHRRRLADAVLPEGS